METEAAISEKTPFTAKILVWACITCIGVNSWVLNNAAKTREETTKQIQSVLSDAAKAHEMLLNRIAQLEKTAIEANRVAKNSLRVHDFKVWESDLRSRLPAGSVPDIYLLIRAEER
jgi:methionine synthase II (cobalamin-independent)